MHNPTTPHRISPAAVAYLAVAVFAGTTLAAIIVAGFTSPFDAPHGLAGGCAAVFAVGSIGYIVRSAVDRVAGLVEHLDAGIAEQREQGYAAGYVDGAAGSRHHLSVVQQR